MGYQAFRAIFMRLLGPHPKTQPLLKRALSKLFHSRNSNTKPTCDHTVWLICLYRRVMGHQASELEMENLGSQWKLL